MQKIATKTGLAGLALWALSALSGCMSRQLVSFETHPEKQTMLLETYETQNYLVWSKQEHVHWSCAEHAQTIECTRRCGKGTNLLCPAGTIFANSATTNVR